MPRVEAKHERAQLGRSVHWHRVRSLVCISYVRRGLIRYSDSEVPILMATVSIVSLLFFLLFLFDCRTGRLTFRADLAGADILKFGIESKRSCLTTSTQAFKKALVQSLREIRVMCEEGFYELESSRIGEEQVQARL